MLTSKIHHLGDFGFRDFVGKYTANANPFLVDMQHYLRGVFLVHREKRLQDMDDELHRRVIVVKHQHLVHRRLFGFRPRFERDAGFPVVVGAAFLIVIRHMKPPMRPARSDRASYTVSSYEDFDAVEKTPRRDFC
mgnify:CR=1 FL=1